MRSIHLNLRKGPIALGTLLVTGCAFVCAFLLLLAAELPGQEEIARTLDPSNSAVATEVYDRNGIKIGEFAAEKRYYVPIEKIPLHVRRAFIAIEDKSFYRHAGISPSAIARALIANAKGKSLQGASTITQQVARLFFLDQQKTIRRKIKEVMLAGKIERHLSKDKILEIYLNKVFLGNNSYGIESAARNYFRKSVKDLTIIEAAILAGLPKAPSKFAPHRHLNAAKRRARAVLKRMVGDGYLSREAAAKWSHAPLQVAKGPMPQNTVTAFFMNEIRKDLARKFESMDLPLRGLKIITTLDSRLQAAAADAVKDNLLITGYNTESGTAPGPKSQLRNDIQAALVTIDPQNGGVLAMQGSSDYRKSQFNRVIATRRSIGAAHLPFLAAAVLKQGYSLNSFPLLSDILQNDLTTEAGPILESLGIGTYAEFIKSMGMNVPNRDMSMVLGSNPVSPIELASAYGIFANEGRRVEPRLVQAVLSKNGRVLYQSPIRRKQESRQVVRPETAATINNLLRLKGQTTVGSVQGTTWGSFASTTASPETATDAWSVAYNPKAVTVVWLGSDHGRTKVADDQIMAAHRANSVWRGYWANIPREVKATNQLVSDFPLPPTRISRNSY